MPVNELIEKAKTYLPPEKMAVIERAYEFALKLMMARRGNPANLISNTLYMSP